MGFRRHSCRWPPVLHRRPKGRWGFEIIIELSPHGGDSLPTPIGNEGYSNSPHCLAESSGCLPAWTVGRMGIDVRPRSDWMLLETQAWSARRASAPKDTRRFCLIRGHERATSNAQEIVAISQLHQTHLSTAFALDLPSTARLKTQQSVFATNIKTRQTHL